MNELPPCIIKHHHWSLAFVPFQVYHVLPAFRHWLPILQTHAREGGLLRAQRGLQVIHDPDYASNQSPIKPTYTRQTIDSHILQKSFLPRAHVIRAHFLGPKIACDSQNWFRLGGLKDDVA